MIQVYTGPGKGKTTAAVGLAIRALGAGKKVFIMQFMKGKAYSEQRILTQFYPDLRLLTTGKPCFVAPEGTLSPEEIAFYGDDLVVFPPGRPPKEYAELLAQGLERAKEAAEKYDVLILDELNVALFFGLIKREALEPWLKSRPSELEVVITGRGAPAWLIAMADLVTEMSEVKHYFSCGIGARKGIEY